MGVELLFFYNEWISLSVTIRNAQDSKQDLGIVNWLGVNNLI